MSDGILELSVDKFLFRFPVGLYYSDAGVWVRFEGNRARIGLSDFTQQRNGDVAFAEPKEVGTRVRTGEEVAVVETIKVNAAVKLATLSQNLGLDQAVLVSLNPELRHDSTPNYPYDLRVPDGYGEKCLACIASLPQYIPPDVVTDRYTVRPGDNLGAIAGRYRTSVDALVRLNGLKSRTLIFPGQVLRVPSRGGVETAAPAPAANAGEKVTYTVRGGDTLFQIAQSFKTTVDKIKADNGLSSDILFVGQKLVITAGKIT